MASRGRNRRGASLARNGVGAKNPKKLVVVICEGAKTEPSYLLAVSQRGMGALIELEIVDEPATSPKQLVDRGRDILRDSAKSAKRSRDVNLRADEVWCIFDVDEHLNIKSACANARDVGVRVAVSNPSIELWFLLHFQNCAGYIDRHQALRDLKKHITDYSKGDFRIEPLLERFDSARERAVYLENYHEKNGTRFPDDNPSSSVWRLVESLRGGY